jgi:fused signal recognition particle receptor
METILIVLAVLVIVGAGLFFLAPGRRRTRGLPLEPPPGEGERRGAGTAVLEPPPVEGPGGTTVLEPPPPAPAPEAPAPEAPPVDEQVVELEVEVVEVEVPVRPSFRDRLGKARSKFASFVGGARGAKIDEDTWLDLEEALIGADVGVELTQELLGGLRERIKAEGITDGDGLLEALKSDLKARLAATPDELALHLADERPSVWLFVGVNGVGKTTTIGKLGTREVLEGRSVVMAAGDTFRAAAAEQLELWAQRSGSDVVRGNEGGDPASVVYDAVERAAARGYDLVLADTAGRLHTKSNLMEELRKVRRVAEKDGKGTVTETLLVLDATTGQNGLRQASEFTQAVDLTGVVLTKLDGSAKGGIVLAIRSQLGIPVKLVGLGEGAGDLVPFDADEFVEALFA